MTNKTTKKALLLSSLSMLLCFAMLLGTTFAWFTDSVTSAGNKIVAGNLDVQLLMNTGSGYADISASTNPIFGSETSLVAQNNNANTLWEPGKTQVAYLMIKNAGSLALKYEVALNTINPADGKDLYEVMQYQIVPDAKYGDVSGWTSGLGVTPGTAVVSANNIPMQPGDEHYFALLVHMDENAGNDYMDGKVEFDITVLATQLEAEADSFGNTYDKDAGLPVVVKNAQELKKAVEAGGNIMLDDDIELTTNLMARKDVVIDLNGKTIKTTASTSLFQSQSNAAPSMIITSSTAGAVIDATGSTFNNGVVHSYGKTEIRNVTINAGTNKVVQVQGNGSVEIYDTVINAVSGNTFNVAGDFTLGEGTVVNVDYLGSSFINNNGKHAIVIDGAKINVGTFRVNGGAMISLAGGTTLALKNTEIKVGLDTTYTSYFISKAENATIENCTFNVTDANGKTYGVEFKPDAGVGARYIWVQK